MHDIVNLIEHNDAMNALADRLIVSARHGHAPASTCHRLMLELAAQFARHLSRQALFLFDDHDGGPFGQAIAELSRQFHDLSTSWQPYLEQWTQLTIESDRKRYAGETVDLMTAFKLRIARENDVLYPLALTREGIGYARER